MEEQWGGLACQIEFLRGLTCLDVRWNFSGVSHAWMSDDFFRGSHMLGCQMELG